MNRWFTEIPQMSSRTYWARVGLLAILIWAYWESVNGILLNHWAIDGYPSFVAAKLWLQGQSDAIYQTQLWVHNGAHPDWKRTLIANGIPNGGTAFVYHPLYLVLVVPFAAFLSLDGFVWFLLAANAISSAILALELIRLIGHENSDRNLMAVAAVCTSFPALYGAYLGQNIVPTLAMLIVGWRFIMERRIYSGSLLLIFAAAIKAWVAPVVLLALVVGGRKVFATGIGVSIVALVLVPLIIDASLFLAYLDITSRLARITVYPFNNVSISAWLTRLTNPDWVAGAFVWGPSVLAPSVRYGAMLILAGALSVAIWCYRLGERSATGLYFGALALLLLLPSVCWSHYLVFLLPAAVFLWLSDRGWRRGFGLCAMVALIVPWHSVPGGIFLRGSMKVWIDSHPDFVVWFLALPMFFALFLALATLSSGGGVRVKGGV